MLRTEQRSLHWHTGERARAPIAEVSQRRLRSPARTGDLRLAQGRSACDAAPVNEIIFEVREDETDGGYVAIALGHAIATQGTASNNCASTRAICTGYAAWFGKKDKPLD
jgi:hypothetical protein